MKYARFAHLPCWTDNKLYLVLGDMSPRIKTRSRERGNGACGVQGTECPCLYDMWVLVLMPPARACRRSSEHICTMRCNVQRCGDEYKHELMNLSLTLVNIQQGLIGHMDHLMFAVVHCKANSCSSKFNSSNRLYECVEQHHTFPTHRSSRLCINAASNNAASQAAVCAYAYKPLQRVIHPHTCIDTQLGRFLGHSWKDEISPRRVHIKAKIIYALTEAVLSLMEMCASKASAHSSSCQQLDNLTLNMCRHITSAKC